MSKRNFILLIIVVVIAVLAVLGYLYFNPALQTGGTDTGGTNFISKFNPFKTTTAPAPKTPSQPVDVSGFQPGPETEMPGAKLKKVSTMPVAGFVLFQKEKSAKEFAPALRYVARSNGNIYQTFADEINEQKFSHWP